MACAVFSISKATLFSRPAPVVSFVAVANIAATAAFSATLSGLSFGSLDATLSIRIGMSSCQTASWASGTSVTCVVSPGVGTGLAAQTTVSGVAGTQTAVFTYDGQAMSVLVAQQAEQGPEASCLRCSPRGELLLGGQRGGECGLQRDGVWPEPRRPHDDAHVHSRAKRLRHYNVGVDVICGLHARRRRGSRPRSARDSGRRCGQPHVGVQL